MHCEYIEVDDIPSADEKEAQAALTTLAEMAFKKLMEGFEKSAYVGAGNKSDRRLKLDAEARVRASRQLEDLVAQLCDTVFGNGTRQAGVNDKNKSIKPAWKAAQK